ncbi:hypothetical protein V8C43DRAFT_317606 [Trichoderma afarasin]
MEMDMAGHGPGKNPCRKEQRQKQLRRAIPGGELPLQGDLGSARDRKPGSLMSPGMLFLERVAFLANIDPFTTYSALDGAGGFSLTTTWGTSWGLLNSRGALDLSWVLNLLRVSHGASKISRVMMMAEKRSPYKENSGAEAREGKKGPCRMYQVRCS